MPEWSQGDSETFKLQVPVEQLNSFGWARLGIIPHSSRIILETK